MIRAILAALATLLSGACAAQGLILGVSEGTSGGLDHAQVIAKYQGLADVIGKSIKQKVSVVFIREFSALEEGMKTGRFDFVMARPSDYPARGLRDYGYHYVASARPDGRCHIIVPKDSPIKSLAEIKGKRIALPETAAYMTKFCRAELRDQGIDLARENVQYVREQGAVVFYLENRFADVGGVASYSGVAKKWEKDGHRVLHKSVAQPYFPLIANRKLATPQIEAIQKNLLGLPEDEAGQAVLKSIGIQAFDTGSEQRLRELLKWLGL
ncbi:phosphate/phosphite/phosphonate ABC transporter substrate-binding protein [Variovorax terrae]|uniref:Phosphate/phosphite/phosphonate ABC transporter substrate-binding protein n=1 Tax=Variovorax terrae TaxID=2923278 RepID=A0A9X2ALR9_9BURK|nr:PhnD/SsuA/transferrin family substrate-binding protein [Variovorax terrae]MCJ0761960.1 phosphate/phosphite/phosphonate ABC transporter substrate-binding protein [Variovorax terrae]